jgi:hypothetical protein
MFLICSLRTNVVFFLIFLFVDLAVLILAGAYWKAAEGNMSAFEKLSEVHNSNNTFVSALLRPCH